MEHRLGRIVCSLLGLLGCGESSNVLSLSLPPSSDAASFVFAVEQPRGGLRVFAFDRDDDRPIRLELDSAPSRIEALVYDEHLEPLGLSEGPVALEETEAGRSLPKPTVVFSAMPQDGMGWQSEDAPSPRALAFRYLPESPCVLMAAKTQPLTSDVLGALDATAAEVTLALPIGADTALIAGHISDRGFLLRATPDEVEAIQGCERPYFAGHETGLGRFWLAPQRSAQIHEVEIDPQALTCRTSTVITLPEPLPEGASINWLTGRGLGQRIPLFVLTSTGTLYKYQAPYFEVLLRAELSARDQGSSGTADGDLVWLGPGRVALAVGSTRVYWWIESTGVRFDEIPVAFDAIAVQELASGFSDGSLYAAATSGEVFKNDGQPGKWITIQRFTIGRETIVPYGEGWIGVAGRAVSQYYDSFGECPASFDALEGSSGSKALAWSSGVVLLPNLLKTGQSGVPELVWLTPK